MDDFESLGHSRWECKCHVVFIPKFRRKVLYTQLRSHLKEAFHKLLIPKTSLRPMADSPKNKKTGQIWEESRTKHTDKNGGWKVGSKPCKPPPVSNKIIVGIDGRILKF